MEKVKIVDGTLREGEQTPGVHFSREEKLLIAAELDRIGVPILDAGMPSVSAEERASISAVSGLGLSASIGVSIRMSLDEVDQALACGADEVFLICPVSPLHLQTKLGMDKKGVKELAQKVVRYAAGKGLGVNLVAEDATRGEIPFTAQILSMAHKRGAARGFVCDTVGIIDPLRMKTLVSELKEKLPKGMGLGVHCHDDLGLATANTLAAIEAGVDYPSVTVNGLGERAGNAPLHEVAVAVQKVIGREHGIDLSRLYDLSRLVERCSGVFIPPHTPIVGFNAFRHESGIHVDGMLKGKDIYTGLDPGEVNRTHSFVLGKHSGTRSIRHLLEQRGYEADEGALQTILSRVKEQKAKQGKKEIHRMVREMEAFYADCLSFSEEAFWDIVEGVIGKGG